VIYEWKNARTGEVVEHDHWSEPPRKPGTWKRVYSVGIGRVEGAGGGRGMPSTRLPRSTRGSR
jgi:hypothetical protein